MIKNYSFIAQLSMINVCAYLNPLYVAAATENTLITLNQLFLNTSQINQDLTVNYKNRTIGGAVL